MVIHSKTIRALCGFLAVVLSAELFPLAAFAAGERISVDNVRFELSGEVVYVYYDLNAPADRIRKVQLTLFRENDIGFVYRPVNLSGDVGTVVFPGQRRRIVWDITQEFPDGLVGDDYYFVVELEVEESTSSNTLLWVGGGAALVGGVLAILLLSGKESTPPPTSSGFPAPPGRP